MNRDNLKWVAFYASYVPCPGPRYVVQQEESVKKLRYKIYFRKKTGQDLNKIGINSNFRIRFRSDPHDLAGYGISNYYPHSSLLCITVMIPVLQFDRLNVQSRAFCNYDDKLKKFNFCFLKILFFEPTHPHCRHQIDRNTDWSRKKKILVLFT